MQGDNAAFCPNCGAEVKGETAFCTQCGARLEGPVETAAPMPAAPPGAVPGMPVPAPRKRGKLPLVLGLIGGLLVIGAIVVLVLVFTVWSGGGGGADNPQALAQKWMSALEKGDVDSYMGCFQQDYFNIEDQPILEGLDIDLKELLEMSLQAIDVKFEGVELETVSSEGDEATVKTVKGTMKVAVMNITDEELDLADDPLVFEMVKEGGTWYLLEDPMPGIMSTGYDMDMEDLDLYEDMDTEDYDDSASEDMDTEDYDDSASEDLEWEKMSPEDVESLLEDMTPEEIEDFLKQMGIEDIDELMEELERWGEELPL